MKEQRFPVTVDPVRLAKSRRELSGQIPVKQLPRLLGLLANGQAEIAAQMCFDVDDQGFVIIQVSIQAELPLICQRDLTLFMMPVNVEVQLTPIETERQAQGLPQQYEPVLMEEGLIVPKTVIEDELLLQIPDVPKRSVHNDEAYISDVGQHQDVVDQTHNPFKDLL